MARHAPPLTMREALLREQAARKLNQSKAAAAIGVSRAVFSRWVSEHNTAYPSLYNMRAVADFLHCSVDDLRPLFPQGYAAQTGSTGGTARERVARMNDQITAMQEQIMELANELAVIHSILLTKSSPDLDHHNSDASEVGPELRQSGL